MKTFSILLLALIILSTCNAYALDYAIVSEHIGERVILIESGNLRHNMRGISGEIANVFVKGNQYYVVLKEENGNIKIINCRHIYTILGVGEIKISEGVDCVE